MPRGLQEQCPNGRRNFVDIGKLREAFKESPETEIVEAIAELETDGFAEMSRSLGRGLPHFRPSLDLYLTFDGLVFDRDPIADTVTVAELALEGPDGVSAETVMPTGRDICRFNPAFEYVASEIPDGRVSRPFGTQFSTQFFHLLAEDRVKVSVLSLGSRPNIELFDGSQVPGSATLQLVVNSLP